MNSKQRNGLLAATFVGASLALFWVGWAYRNQNIPLWRVKIPMRKGMTTGISRLAWSRDGSTLWAQQTNGWTFRLDSMGKLKHIPTPSDWGTGQDGRLYYSLANKIYERNGANDTLRPDLRLLSRNFVESNYYEHSARIDWASQTVLESDARGPVHLWPLQRGAKTITLVAPRFGKNLFPMPYDLNVSPNRNRCVVVYGLAKMGGNRWPASWNGTSFSPKGGRAVLFDLETRHSKVLGDNVDVAQSSPPRMDFGASGVRFSASGRLFVIDTNPFFKRGFQIYDAASGNKRAFAPLSKR